MLPRLTAALIATAILAACGPGLSSSLPTPVHEPGYDRLNVRILPHSSFAGFDRGMIQFVTDRPAYTALFEIVPGQGASLLHPRHGYDARPLAAGAHWVDTRWSTQRWAYERRGWDPMGSAWGLRSSRRGMVGTTPTYYLLVASERPLRTAPYVGSPLALRRDLGIHRFTSLNAYDVMEDLVGMVLPDHASYHGWAADVYVHWPMDSQPPARMALLQPLICPGGYVVVGGLCPRPDQVADGDEGGDEPEDTLRRPSPTRPIVGGDRRPAVEPGDNEGRRLDPRVALPQPRPLPAPVRPGLMPPTQTRDARARAAQRDRSAAPIMRRLPTRGASGARPESRPPAARPARPQSTGPESRPRPARPSPPPRPPSSSPSPPPRPQQRPDPPPRPDSSPDSRDSEDAR